MSLVLLSFMLVHTGFFDEFRGLLKTLYSIFFIHPPPPPPPLCGEGLGEGEIKPRVKYKVKGVEA